MYRAAKRMTQQEPADLAGVSGQTIMQPERNRYRLSMMLAYSISKCLMQRLKIYLIFRR